MGKLKQSDFADINTPDYVDDDECLATPNTPEEKLAHLLELAERDRRLSELRNKHNGDRRIRD